MNTDNPFGDYCNSPGKKEQSFGDWHTGTKCGTGLERYLGGKQLLFVNKLHLEDKREGGNPK